VLFSRPAAAAIATSANARFTTGHQQKGKIERLKVCNYRIACSSASDVPKQQRCGSEKKLGINYFSFLYIQVFEGKPVRKGLKGGGG
jgi:hypothetical protein